MRSDNDSEDRDQGALEAKARRAGTRHLVLGFLTILLLLFLVSWCSLP